MNFIQGLFAGGPTDVLIQILILLATLVLAMVAIIIHEVSHGYVAYLLGDPTAKNAGRLTANPLAHIDLTGTVVLPLIMAIIGGPIFGYAKPVPYNPSYFQNIRKGELLVALAGPFSNLIQALVGALIFRLCTGPLAAIGISADILGIIATLAMLYVRVNLVLMLFNLIPLPPLDGSAIIAPFLSDKALKKYYSIQSYSMVILLIVLFLVPYVTGINPIGIYLSWALNLFMPLLLGA